jgi:hypothetical protein
VLQLWLQHIELPNAPPHDPPAARQQVPPWQALGGTHGRITPPLMPP